MKALIMIAIVTLSVAHCFGQDEYDRRDAKQPESIIKLKNDPNPYPHKYDNNLNDLCLRYKGVQTGGIVLSIIGGGLTVSGGVILNKGNNSNKIITDDNGKPQKDPHQKMIGAALIGTGVVSLLAGIPMVAVGAAKIKNACGYEPPKRNRSYLQLQSDDTGLGMALKF